MALVLKDRVKETTTTTGTGTLTLAGAVDGFQSFAAVGNGNTTYYSIVDTTSGDWEVGIGTYTASGTTLSRTTVLSSSNGGSLVSFGAGEKDVFVTYPSEVSATAQVGDVVQSDSVPIGPGTWLETGKYYSKAAYPALAAKVGDVADFGTPNPVSTAVQLPQPTTTAITGNNPYWTATNGVVTVFAAAGGAIRVSTDGVNWAGVPSTTSAELNEVRYLNGNFVVVGGSSNTTGAIVTSTDGYTWVSRAVPTVLVSGTAHAQTASVAYGASMYVVVGTGGVVRYSSDLSVWTAVQISGVTATLNRVVYGNSTFVTVGASGVVATSTDGINWVNRTTALMSGTFVDVIYANSKFVAVTSAGVPWYSTDGIAWSSDYLTAPTSSSNPYAAVSNGSTAVFVGSSGTIMQSSDGITWASVRSGTTQSFAEVEYLNGNFVAVGGTGTIATSTNGSAWTLRTSNTGQSLNSSAYGAGVYVAVGASGAITRSSDLVTWTVQTVGAAQFNRVLYANGLFVAVGASGACYTSPDGITWTSRSAGATQLMDVIYDNGLFVAVGFSGALYTSPDGVTWTSRTSSGSNYYQIVYANGLFVVVGAAGSCFTSPDGITWTSRATNAGGVTLYSIVWNGSSFVVVGDTGNWASSPDGITWTGAVDVSYTSFFGAAVVFGKTVGFGTNASVLLAGATRQKVFNGSVNWGYSFQTPSIGRPKPLAYSGSVYVASATAGSVIRSTNGVNWSAVKIPATSALHQVQYLNGNFLTFGNNSSGAVYFSTDGSTWTPSTTTTFNTLSAAAYGAGVYVLVGNAGAVFSSSDLLTWTSRSAGSTTFNDVTFANGLFVAVGNTGTCYTSPDGITWTSRSAGATALLRVIYANSLYVAIGNTGTIYTSPDGTTWTLRTSNVSGNLNDIVWNGSLFVAVGATESITTSPDGVTWTARTTGATSATLTTVAWSGSTFIVAGATNFYYSTDGLVWLRRYNPRSSVPYCAYAGGKFIGLGSSTGVYSTDGDFWYSFTEAQYNALPWNGPTVNGLSYTNSKFFIVGSGTSGNLSTSTDGATWTSAYVGAPNISTSQNWFYCLWNGSSYYLSGSTGRYSTSSDAVTWATPTQDVSASSLYTLAVVSGKTIGFGVGSCVLLAGAARTEVLQSGSWAFNTSLQANSAYARLVAYNGSNQYVAVGLGGAIIVSSDGQSWTGGYSGTVGAFSNVQYVNGNYFVMGATDAYSTLLTSPDGVTWTARFLATNSGQPARTAVAYGAGVYVAVGYAASSTGSIFSSTDLNLWTPRLGIASTLFDVIFANGVFVAVGASGACYSSPDGITWTSRSVGASSFVRVIYANSLFVAVGSAGALYTSPDGTTWTQRSTGTGNNLRDVVWSGSLFVVVGASGMVLTSPDGVTWTSRVFGDTSPTLFCVGWNGTRFVAAASNQTGVFTSTDGIAWSRCSTAHRNSNTNFGGYVGGKFWLLGSGGNVQSSTDGLTWTNADPVQYVPTSASKVYKFGGVYYVVTSGGGVYRSADGVTFTLTSRNIPAGTAILRAMAYSGSVFVLTAQGTGNQPLAFFTSTDGVSWTKSFDLGTLTTTSVTPSNSVDVVYAGGNFIFGTALTAAQNIVHTIYTSPDGTTWTGRNTPLLAAPNNAIGSNGTWAIFNGGATGSGTCRSTDGGVTWQTIANTSGTVLYAGGYWCNGLQLTEDFSKSVYGTTPENVYVSNGYALYIGSSLSTRQLVSAKGGGFNLLFMGPGFEPSFQIIATYKEIVTRGSVGILPLSRSDAVAPNVIGEIPLYSYDTSTTFFVPYATSAVKNAYIYAGA